MPVASTHAAFSRSMANLDLQPQPGSRRRRQSLSSDLSRSMNFLTDPSELMPFAGSLQVESPTSVAVSGKSQTRTMKSKSSHSDDGTTPVGRLRGQGQPASEMKDFHGFDLNDTNDSEWMTITNEDLKAKKRRDKFSQSCSSFDFDPGEFSNNGEEFSSPNKSKIGNKNNATSSKRQQSLTMPNGRGHQSFAVGDFAGSEVPSVRRKSLGKEHKRIDRFAKSFSSFDISPADLVSTSGSSSAGSTEPQSRPPRQAPPSIDNFMSNPPASALGASTNRRTDARSVATTTRVEKQKLSLEEFHNPDLFPPPSKRKGSGSKSVSSGTKSVSSAGKSVSSGSRDGGSGKFTKSRHRSRSPRAKLSHRSSPENMHDLKSSSRSRSKSRERSLRKDRRSHSIERRDRRSDSIEKSEMRRAPLSRTVHTESSAERRPRPTHERPTRTKSSGDASIAHSGGPLSRSRRSAPRRTLSGEFGGSPEGNRTSQGPRRCSIAGFIAEDNKSPGRTQSGDAKTSSSGASVASSVARSTRGFPRRTMSSDGSTVHRHRKAMTPSDSKALHASLSVLSYDHQVPKADDGKSEVPSAVSSAADQTADPDSKLSSQPATDNTSSKDKEKDKRKSPGSVPSTKERRRPSRSYSRSSIAGASVVSSASTRQHRKSRELPKRASTYDIGHSSRRLLQDGSSDSQAGRRTALQDVSSGSRKGRKPSRRASTASASVTGSSRDLKPSRRASTACTSSGSSTGRKPSRRASTACASSSSTMDRKPSRRASTACSSSGSSKNRKPSRRASTATAGGASVSSGVGNASASSMNKSMNISKRQLAHVFLKEAELPAPGKDTKKHHSNASPKTSSTNSDAQRKKRSSRRRSLA